MNLHVDIRAKLASFHESKNIPHILFYGDHGSGKKTLVYDFINLIYAGNRAQIKQNTYFSNCSHSKGIRHIRENLKEYSRGNVAVDGIYFKCVVLYNFENLSVDGQSALRRVIESYSYNTRFFLISHSKERILAPILSRFAQIFVPLPIIHGRRPISLYRHNIDNLFRAQSAGADAGAAAATETTIIPSASTDISVDDIADTMAAKKREQYRSTLEEWFLANKEKASISSHKDFITLTAGGDDDSTLKECFLANKEKASSSSSSHKDFVALSAGGGGGDDEHSTHKECFLANKLPSHKDFVALTDDMTQNAFSCLDVMQFIRESQSIDGARKTTIDMCFLKVRGDFPNENLLILYMLDFVFYHDHDRSQYPLENVSFM